LGINHLKIFPVHSRFLDTARQRTRIRKAERCRPSFIGPTTLSINTDVKSYKVYKIRCSYYKVKIYVLPLIILPSNIKIRSVPTWGCLRWHDFHKSNENRSIIIVNNV